MSKEADSWLLMAGRPQRPPTVTGIARKAYVVRFPALDASPDCELRCLVVEDSNGAIADINRNSIFVCKFWASLHLDSQRGPKAFQGFI